MDNRTLEALGLHEAPRENPLVYPGVWPAESGLLYQNQYLRLYPRPRRRLAKWLVEQPSAGLSSQVPADEPVPLDHALMCANTTLAGSRFPVISVGSNACPAQLRHKMRSEGVSSTIPITKATVTRLDIGVSAYVSPMGYVSSSPVLAPGLTRELFITWLDSTQLDVVDASEGVHQDGGEYDRLLLPASATRVELESGEVLGGVYLYVHRYGVLHDGSRSPRRHPGERGLLTELLGESRTLREWFGTTPEEFSSRARGNAELCEKGTRLFRDEDRVTESGLEQYRHLGLVYTVYDDIHPANELPPGTSYAARTPDSFDQRGSGVVRLSRAQAAALGHPRHVIVQNAQIPRARHERLGALASLVVAPDIPPHAEGTIQVDHSLRVGVGLEPGEAVTVRPARLPRTRRTVQEFLVGPQTYITCRVQDGDRASAELEVCLLDELTLELLGVSSGDGVVLEGFPDPAGDVPVLQLKAIRASTEVLDRRRELHGGDMTSRYPSSLDALGVHPDLPWVFLDRRLWSGLGIEGQWLGTVRVRCSRSYQIKKELREMVFLLGIAFIGVVTLLRSILWQTVSLAVLVLLVAGIVTIRLRSRLNQRARRVGGVARE